MTQTELLEGLSKVISRGVVVHGFGMIDLFVPVKSVNKTKDFVLNLVPLGILTAVKLLKTQMKKGIKAYSVKDIVAKDPLILKLYRDK